MNLRRIVDRLYRPVDIASIVFFRIAFGGIMLWEVWRYLSKGWIDRYWVDPQFHFTYYGFDWVQPLPGPWMHVHFYVLAALAACIALGIVYRLSTLLFLLGFTYVFLLDQTRYLNHFYLVTLMSFLLILVPAYRSFSVDSWVFPKLRSSFVPTWALWILRFQIAVPYIFGGIAKLNADWLQGQPLSMWIEGDTDFPLIGQFFNERWMGTLLSYGGLFLDFAIVPFLLWKRTRWQAFILAVLFNLMNAELFSIGIFPWFMITGTTLFFEPDWPRRVLRWIRIPMNVPKEVGPSHAFWKKGAIISFLGAYVLLQLLVPLRHFLYGSVVHWSEEGHRFAWHMKLRSKRGDVHYRVVIPATGERYVENPDTYLTDLQVDKMSTHPEMILQFAHFLAEHYMVEGIADVEIYADATASLNGRKSQALVDPTVNLVAIHRSLWHANWIVPLENPLP